MTAKKDILWIVSILKIDEIYGGSHPVAKTILKKICQNTKCK
jgi:hypothetical protein